MLYSAQQTARSKDDGPGAAAITSLSACLARGRFRSELPEAELRQRLLECAPGGACNGASPAERRSAGGAALQPAQQERVTRHSKAAAGAEVHVRAAAGGPEAQRMVTSLLQQGYLIRDDRHGTPLLRLAMPGAGSVVRAASCPLLLRTSSRELQHGVPVLSRPNRNVGSYGHGNASPARRLRRWRRPARRSSAR